MLRTLTLAAVAACISASTGLAQATIPDSLAYREYRLTDSTLTKFAAASKAILEANQRNELPSMNLDDVETIDGMAAFYDRTPALHDALARAGISARDFVLFMTTAFQAGVGSWIVERSGWKALPHNVAPENVRFYRKHAPELARMNQELARLREGQQ